MKKLVNCKICWNNFRQGTFFWDSFYWSTFCWIGFHCVYNFIAYNYWFTNNISYIFTIFVVTCYRVPKKPFLHTRCSFGFWNSRRHLLLFYFWFKLLFLFSNLHSHLHDVCFVNVLDWFIPVIIWKIMMQINESRLSRIFLMPFWHCILSV